MSRKPLSFAPGTEFETDDGRPARFIGDVSKPPYNIKSRGAFSFWFSVPKLNGTGKENAYVDANGYGADGKGAVNIRNIVVKETKSRMVIDTREWRPGYKIPLTNGTFGAYSRDNVMPGKLLRFQIVGTCPQRTWWGGTRDAPVFWDDETGRCSWKRGPDIDLKKVPRRVVPA